MANAKVKTTQAISDHQPQPSYHCLLSSIMDESFASTSSISSVHPNFHQLSHLLISRGFIKHPLQVESLPADHLQVLADLLYEFLSQRDQDVEFRETLIGKNRTLESSLDRSNRFLKEEKEKSLNEEKKAMKERAKAE